MTGGKGPYRKGAELERHVKRAYEAAGFFVVRSPQSGSPIDLLCVPPSLPQDNELAWAAGLFDGEGTIVTHRHRDSRAYVGASLYNTNEASVRRFSQIIGDGGRYVYEQPKAAEHHLQCYVWSRTGSGAVRALTKLAPLLRIKQAKLVKVFSECGQPLPCLGEIEFVQVKTRGYMTPAEREAVLELTRRYGGLPILAWGKKPISRKDLREGAALEPLDPA